MNNERSHRGLDRSTEIARNIIISPDYGRRLSTLKESPKIQKKIIDEARRALFHRNGSRYEDLIFIHSATGEIKRSIDHQVENEGFPTASMIKMATRSADHTIISIHNHPNSSVPSPMDIASQVSHRYKYGLVVGHDGSIYKYFSANGYNPLWYGSAIRKLDETGYTQDNLLIFVREALEASVYVEVL